MPGSVFIKQQAPTGHGSDCNALYHMACWLADLLMLACCLVKALLDASFEKYTGCLNIPILRVLLGDRGQRDRETRTGLLCTVEKPTWDIRVQCTVYLSTKLAQNVNYQLIVIKGWICL